jgi:hypothetical protein
LRELTYTFEKDCQQWAHDMQLLLLEIKKAVEENPLLEAKQLSRHRKTSGSSLKKTHAPTIPTPISK